MEKIIKDLNEKVISLKKEIDEFDNLKLKRDILKQIIERMSVKKTYNDIKNDLMFIETSLSIIYPEKEAREYSDLLMMILAGLIHCQDNFDISNNYYRDFQNKLKSLITHFKSEYEIVKKQIHEINVTKKRSLLDRIKRCLKFINGNYYTEDNLKEIRRVLKNLNYSDEDIVIFLENCQVSQGEKSNFDVIELFNYKFAYVEQEKVSFENRNLISSLYYNILAKIDGEFSLTVLTSLILELPSNSFDVRKGVIQKLLEYFKEKYQSNKVLLYDEDFYFSKEFKDEILAECRLCICFYEFLLEEYQRISNEELLNDEPLNTNRRLMLARNSEVTYLERDIKDLDKEILEGAMELLKDINNNSPLVVFKKLQGFEDLYEFKYNNHNNQLRVVVKNIKGNIYAIVGMIQKKETWGNKYFSRIEKRVIDTRRIEENLASYSSEMDSIYKYIEENKRKGTRK